MSNVGLAIFLGALAYSLLNIGMALQKKGAATLPKIEKQSFFQNLKNFLTNKTWLLGYCLIQIQWFFLTLALDYGSISLVTPLMGVGIASCVLFSFFYLKEPLSKVELLGIIIIIVGVVILGVFTPKEETEKTFDEMNSLLASIGSIIFLILILIVIVVSIVFSVVREFAYADVLFGIAAGVTDGLGAIFLKAYMAGVDYTNVSQAAVGRWEWWLYLFIFIPVTTIATVLLQVAYQRGKAVIVAPIFSVMGLIVPVLAGIIIFLDWHGLGAGMIVAKIASLILITVGIVILTVHSARHKKIEEEPTSEADQDNNIFDEESEKIETEIDKTKSLESTPKADVSYSGGKLGGEQ